MAFACVHCNHNTILARVSYSHNGKLFTGVPVRVCTNEACVSKMGATVLKSRSISRPPGIYRPPPESTVETVGGVPFERKPGTRE